HETTVKTRMTSVVVTHDVQAGLDIADHVILLWQGKIIAEGEAESVRQSEDPRVQQFIKGEPNGPIPFSRSQTAYIDDLTHKPGCVRLD
ncbi:MAG: ABC transporter ATP-binding protein, partial [Ghiorsea sp.]|nr:ABC transporter ATP-binding protein [Ghiorsea sp.]